MNKRKYFIILLVALLGLGFSTYQYFQTFKTEVASAVTVGIPNPGHAWSTMECSANTLCIDTANNRLGIGTNAPTQALDVRGSASFPTADTSISFGSDVRQMLNLYSTTYGIGVQSSTEYFRSGGNFAFYKGGVHSDTALDPGSGGTALMTILSSGNVGIGTNAPSKKLEVNGSILASGTGDVCNGAGKCLSSIFQTNVIVGTNPTCPTGQTAIAKMSGTTWYSSAQSSWSQIMCGQALSADGSAFLVNNSHTNLSCTTAGGTVVSDGTYNMCKFTAAACPSGWTKYNNWTTTAGTCGSCGSWTGHAFANNSTLETSPYVYCRDTTGSSDPCGTWHGYSNTCSGGCGCSYAVTCGSATVTQVGCF